MTRFWNVNEAGWDVFQVACFRVRFLFRGSFSSRKSSLSLIIMLCLPRNSFPYAFLIQYPEFWNSSDIVCGYSNFSSQANPFPFICFLSHWKGGAELSRSKFAYRQLCPCYRSVKRYAFISIIAFISAYRPILVISTQRVSTRLTVPYL